ncbi:receptor family ligand binding region family protein 19 [Acetonema longum DSM 6540]|uniref:Receptor family ligand binding region family protein 19 n=2 Tax=Acetonema TaxID=2373 RepID=F7NHT0_9FIRM|nr:receptor family ligand binding region family protein 19 [Acetonema longum DSM 6540]
MHQNKKTVLPFFIFLIALSMIAAGCSSVSKESPAAAKEVKIGTIFPMTGAAAVTGVDLMNGIQLAAEIINGDYPDLDLPLAKGTGLPNLGGAKLVIVSGDHQGSAEKGMSEAERLITQEKVVALMGSYHSAVTATASQVAERNGIPFLNDSSTSPSLVQRNFKWFFRTTPDDDMFADNFFQFMNDLKEKKLLSEAKLGIIYENTLWGSDVGKAENRFAGQYGYTVATDMAYPAKSTNVTSEVQKLKASGSNILLQASYASDAILYMKAYKELDYNPDAILAMDAGFIDTEFLKALGKDGEYIFSREVWALDLAKNKPIVEKVNALYKQKYGVNMNGNTARAFTGVMVLADAINRAGSTDPAAIKKALEETNIPANQLIMPWKGVKFDPATHQNILGSGIIVQIQNGEYVTVWPWNLASEDIVWPMPKWSERK